MMKELKVAIKAQKSGKILSKYLKGKKIKVLIISLTILIVGFLFIQYIDLLSLGTYLLIGVAIIAVLVELKLLSPELFSQENARFIQILSNLLLAYFIFVTAYLSYQTFSITLQEYNLRLPQYISQIRTYDFGSDGSRTYYLYDKENKSFYLPIYLTIDNVGQLPIYFTYFTYTPDCGPFRNEEVPISLPKNQSTLIRPGETYKFTEEIFISDNYSIELPCNLTFNLFFPNNYTKTHIISIKDGSKND